MCPAGRCRPLSKASLLQADKWGLMLWSPGSETHFQTSALCHDSTRPHGNVLAHVPIHFSARNTHHSYVQIYNQGCLLQEQSHEFSSEILGMFLTIMNRNKGVVSCDVLSFNITVPTSNHVCYNCN